MDNISGRTIAITGAARGIGHVTAKAGMVAVPGQVVYAGTKDTGAQKPVPPEDIAAAIVRTLDKPKTHVSVPTPLRFIGAATSMLGPRGRRRLAKKTVNDRVFLDFDTSARKSYEDRAQCATGVVEAPSKATQSAVD